MSAAATAPEPEHGRQHSNVTLAVLFTGALAYALSQTMIAPALPAIQNDLDASTTLVTFALTAFLLTASIATPIIGRLGDMFGKERLLVITLIIFALGSLVCALSHSIGLLIAGRAIQGIGGAVFPLSFGIIRDEFPREKVATGIGLISATFGIGGGAGLVLSGLIVDHLAYEWIFWLGLIVVDPGRDRHASLRSRVAGEEPGRGSTGSAPRCSPAALVRRCSSPSARATAGAGLRRRPSA